MEEKLYYESDGISNIQPCRECGNNNVFTRIYFHEKKMESHYLCRNCAEQDFVPKGFKLLTVDFKWQPPAALQPLEQEWTSFLIGLLEFNILQKQINIFTLFNIVGTFLHWIIYMSWRLMNLKLVLSPMFWRLLSRCHTIFLFSLGFTSSTSPKRTQTISLYFLQSSEVETPLTEMQWTIPLYLAEILNCT